jgi:DNA-binding transcriptional LysR family regulator
MELSRQQAIKRMVEEDMGVGIVPLQSVKEEVEKGKLIRWWIEGAQINWELGIARLSGGYESPIMQSFLRLARKHFGEAENSSKKTKSKPIAKAADKSRASR